MDTTCVNKANTKARVIQKANAEIGGQKEVELLSEFLMERHAKRAGDNLRTPQEDPLRQAQMFHIARGRLGVA